jgi:hypothetical protein
MPFNLETFRNNIFEFNEFKVGNTYYLYTLDINYRVHGSLIKFKLNSYHEKDELAIYLYNKICKRIYKPDGTQRNL